MPKVETRAQAYGVKPKSLRSKARTALARCRKQLEKLAYEWSEIDGAVEQDIDAAYRYLDDIQAAVDASIEELKKPWGSDHG